MFSAAVPQASYRGERTLNGWRNLVNLSCTSLERRVSERDGDSSDAFGDLSIFLLFVTGAMFSLSISGISF